MSIVPAVVSIVAIGALSLAVLAVVARAIPEDDPAAGEPDTFYDDPEGEE